MFMTGYFGIPGFTATTKIHVVENGKPICGWRPGKRMQFQFCSTGIHHPYIECGHCKAKAAKIEKEAA